jgi:N-hydroxyarylamine O-acetyltransferase
MITRPIPRNREDLPVDLDAYCARIGYAGPRSPTLATLHGLIRAHVQAIPFENIDVLLGEPIELETSAVMAKLVHARRGGYCFEQNTLLLAVLTALGFHARPLSARVRWQRPRDFTPARTHLLVRVELEESWLADVGIGAMSPTSALRLADHGEQATPHEPRRLHREGEVVYHQVRFGDVWHDVAELTLEEMPLIDRVVANWYTSTHPQSHFKNRLLVARATSSGRVTLLDDQFSLRGADGMVTKQRVESHDHLLHLLDAHFGLTLPSGTRLPLFQ